MVGSGGARSDDQFCLVLKGKLGEQRLLFGGEVDAAMPAKDQLQANNSNNREYVELKTNRRLDNPNQRRNFYRNKGAKWWLQSFLVGIRGPVRKTRVAMPNFSR